MAAAGNGEAVAGEATRLDLQAFERAVHVTHRAAAAGFFAEDVPRFERGAELDLQIPLLQIADAREAKLKVRREPIKLERITGLAQVADDVGNPSRKNAATSSGRGCLCPSARGCSCKVLSRICHETARKRCCARLICACGGISNARISTSPRRPALLSGANSLSIENSARCVLPLESINRLRNNRSDNHGGV